jgi:hypothetical protein
VPPLSPGIGSVMVVGVPCGPGTLMPMPGALVAVGAGVLVGVGALPMRIGGFSISDMAQ